MDVDRIQDAKGKGKKGKNDSKKGKGKDAKGKEKENRKEKKVITRAKAKAKTKKEKVWQHVTLVGSQDILLETGETTFDRLQVMQPIHLQEELQ